MSETRDRAVALFSDGSEVHSMLAGALEIKTFTGEKTLTNAVALFLHAYWVECFRIYRCVRRCSMVRQAECLEEEKNAGGVLRLGSSCLSEPDEREEFGWFFTTGLKEKNNH